MKNEFNYLAIFTTVLMMLFVSCKKDKEAHINVTVVNSSTHNIKVEENDDNLQLTVEVLSDTTNNLAGTWPNIDFLTVYIDRNANGVIDEDLDWGIGTSAFNTICTFFIKDSISTSTCGEIRSDASLSSSLAASTLSADEHIIWDISIPKAELDDSKPLNMVIKAFAEGEGYTTFPEANIFNNSATLSFGEVLSIDW